MEVPRCQGLYGTRKLRTTRRQLGRPIGCIDVVRRQQRRRSYSSGGRTVSRAVAAPLHVCATPRALLSSVRGQHGGGENVIERVMGGKGSDGRWGVASLRRSTATHNVPKLCCRINAILMRSRNLFIKKNKKAPAPLGLFFFMFTHATHSNRIQIMEIYYCRFENY